MHLIKNGMGKRSTYKLTCIYLATTKLNDQQNQSISSGVTGSFHLSTAEILAHLRCITPNQLWFTTHYLAYITAIQMRRHHHLSAMMFVAMSHQQRATSSQLTFITQQLERNCNTHDQRLSLVCSAQLRLVLSYGSSILKNIDYWALAPPQFMLTTKRNETPYQIYTHLMEEIQWNWPPKKMSFRMRFSYHVNPHCYEDFQQDSFVLAFLIHQPRSCKRCPAQIMAVSLTTYKIFCDLPAPPGNFALKYAMTLCPHIFSNSLFIHHAII